MTQKDKNRIIAATIVAVIILILWMLGRKAKTITTADQLQGAAIPVVGGNIEIFPADGISIPSINFPPHEGPIIWPSFDTGGNGANGVCGISACGCDGNNSGLIYGNTYYGWYN